MNPKSHCCWIHHHMLGKDTSLKFHPGPSPPNHLGKDTEPTPAYLSMDGDQICNI